MKLTWFRTAVLVILTVVLSAWLTRPATPPVAAPSTLGATRYPIVLVHGMTGFDELKLGLLGQHPYWLGIDTGLRSQGANVFVVQVSAFNSSELRGEQLLKQLEQIRVESGAQKVNLIGHSQGGPTSRYAAAKHPEWVASVTSVAGPTFGSEVADWVQQQVDKDSLAATIIMALARSTGSLVNWASDSDLPQNPNAALASLTSAGAAEFNRKYSAGVPSEACGQGAAQVNGIHYFSWSGVGTFHFWGNPADYLMSLTGLIFKQPDNDGLVGRCSSHLGLVIRDDYPMNHFHVVNQLFGLVGEGADPVATYIDHAKRLRAAGL